MADRQSRLIELETPSGAVILAEASSVGGGDVASAGKRFSLAESRTALAELGSWALDTVRKSLPDQPDHLEVEFGLKLAVKSGKLLGVLAEASGESSLVVRMVWDKGTSRDGSQAG